MTVQRYEEITITHATELYQMLFFMSQSVENEKEKREKNAFFQYLCAQKPND